MFFILFELSYSDEKFQSFETNNFKNYKENQNILLKYNIFNML